MEKICKGGNSDQRKKWEKRKIKRRKRKERKEGKGKQII